MSIQSTVDSLIANEFAFEINGEAVDGVFRISNLVTFQLDEAGNASAPPFEVHKMVQRDGNNAFNTWLKETRSGGKPRRDLTVVAVDDGVEIRRWTAKNAWIQEVRYSDMDSASFEMVAEIFVIQYDAFEETWTATD